MEQNNKTQTEVRKTEENPLYNILFNIVLPVTVLNQLSKRLGEQGPLIALLVGLSIPILYGAYDYWKRRKNNILSILGFLNIAITGGFALLKLRGIWFAWKEAAFPLLIGIAVLGSIWFNKPFLKTMFWNDRVFAINKIDAIVANKNNLDELTKLFSRGTLLFSLSFFISALLNFVLAKSIFLPIDETLPLTAQHEILNQQIAKMTWKGYLVIALPMIAITGLIIWYFVHSLKKITGLKMEEIMVADNQ